MSSGLGFRSCRSRVPSSVVRQAWMICAALRRGSTPPSTDTYMRPIPGKRLTRKGAVERLIRRFKKDRANVS